MTYLDKMTRSALEALGQIIEATLEEPQDSPIADEHDEVPPMILGQLRALRSEIQTRTNAAATAAEVR